MPRSAEPTVLLRRAIALIGRFPVLAGVDLTVDAGEVVAVHGPNGSGKTSLLRLCAGLLPLQAGEARVLGVDLGADRRAVRRAVGLLGHHSALYDDLTVTENVTFAVRAAGADPAAVGPTLDRLDLRGRIERTPVAALSAGQRRRVALAAVLARRPRLWLLDEPHAALDPDARDLLDRIVAEAAAGGATVLLASHDTERSTALATRTVHLQGGRVISSGAGGLALPAEPPAAPQAPLQVAPEAAGVA